MPISDLRWFSAATAPVGGAATTADAWWRRALHVLSKPVWATLLAALVGFVLLVSFHQVVANSVSRSEQRHTAMAEQVRQLWRCKLLPAGAGRDHCLAPSREAPGSMPSGGTAPLSSNHSWRTE